MFSKEESKKLRQDFWIAFGKSYPRKWTLYDTKIKGLALKFHFNLKNAMVSIDIEHHDLETRIILWDKLLSIQSILKNDFIPEAQFMDSFILVNRKEISRVYVEKKGVSIHNKNTWRETMEFFNKTMIQFEDFFIEYRDIISS